MKKIISTILLILFSTLSYADVLMVPTFGLLPSEFVEKMANNGYKVTFKIDEIDRETFAYVEYTGTTFVIKTVNALSMDELESMAKLFRGGNGEESC